MRDDKLEIEEWKHEFEFSVPIWSDPFRYLLVLNAAGTIAVIAALAQVWSSSSEMRAPLLFGLREFLYGMSFGVTIVSFSIFIILFKRLITHLTTAFLDTLTSTIILFYLNIAWIAFYFGFIVLGFGQFFCNSFDLVQAVSMGLPDHLKEEFLTPARGCEVPRGIVHWTSNFWMSHTPWASS